jgi:acetylornithine deacetylase
MNQHDIIERLIGFPTVSRDSNLALIHFIADLLDSHGIEARIITNEDGSKANLHATVGPNVEGGVVLSGHTDVVPIDGQDWHTDPFKASLTTNGLTGRGSADMKAFCGIALSLVGDMGKLRKPIHLAFSYDEEVGCLGAPALISALTERLPKPAAIIVGEPTNMQVVTRHKGIVNINTRVTGFEAHSSLQHLGVPAVMYAARLIHWLAERQDQCRREAAPDSPFEPPHTTLHCGVINGGTAHNITARQCDFVTDIRALPGEDPLAYVAEFKRFATETLLPQMQAVNAASGFEFDVTANVPAFFSNGDDDAVRIARQLTGENDCHGVAFASECGQFQEAGYPVVMCGPGSIDQAHQPNEFIALDQISACDTFVRRLIDRLSA